MSKKVLIVVCSAILLMFSAVLISTSVFFVIKQNHKQPTENNQIEIKENVFNVTFDACSGEQVNEQQVIAGQKAVEPQTTREGYEFLGWYLNETLFDFNTAISRDIKLFAKWEKLIYNVAFDSLGGSEVNTQQVYWGETAEEPVTPTKDDYDFAGWYLDSEYTQEYDFATLVTGNLELSAKWEEHIETVVDITSDCTFELIDGTYQITGYNGSLKDIVLPTTYQDTPVTIVGIWAFENSNITSVVIPEGYLKLRDEAFMGCSRLVSVTLPDSLTYIGGNAFKDCAQLNSITIPNAVEQIWASAFENTALETVVIPNSVTTIKNNIFDKCTNLKTIYCEAYSRPSGWAYNTNTNRYWYGSTCTAEILWGDQWEYVDGVPTKI